MADPDRRLIAMATSGFEYELAFSRNIGWLTHAEQARLRASRVAIAGLGGVGGSHLLALARLGVEKFSLADFDTFGVENFNRQAGAMMSTVGHRKLDCLARMVRDINPDCDLRLFPEGVTGENLSSFLEDADLYLDSLDFFALDIRRAVFQHCAQSGIPAVTAAPLGMSGAVLTFLPGRMSFEEYFRLEGCDPAEAQLRFLLGLAPRMLHRSYLVDPSSVDLEARRGPSTTIACHLCTGLAVAESTKLLIGRGPVLTAPRGFQVDGYRNRIVRTWRPWGNAHPFQRIALRIARHQLQGFKERKGTNTTLPERSDRVSSQSPIEQVLDFARWAPSGDNAQPWRFESRGENEATVHGFDTRDAVVYDLDGRASQLALGALMETIRLGAGRLGASAKITVREPLDEQHPRLDVRLVPDPEVKPDPLCRAVLSRSVARGLMSTEPVSRTQRAALEDSLPPGFKLIWFLGLRASERAHDTLDAGGLAPDGDGQSYPWGNRIAAPGA
jgi:molybdopterin/thiamine biosynthesis adenylyltransferase